MKSSASWDDGGIERINPTMLSARAILPWEKAEEYLVTVTTLVDEHQPEGPIEEYLVDELAWILWRKRRLAMAETSAFRDGLARTMAPYGGTVPAALATGEKSAGFEGWVERAIHTPEGVTTEEIEGYRDAETSVQGALQLLNSKRSDDYAAAVGRLREDLVDGWEWELENDPKKPLDERVGYTRDAKGLRAFLEGNVLRWSQGGLKEAQGRRRVKDQAYGEAMEALRALDDHEAYLDRKFESTLEALMRHQSLRQPDDW